VADLSGVQLHLVNNVAEANAFMTWLSERRPDDIIGLDTETGELKGNPLKDAFSPWRGQLRLVQVGDGQTAWAIPWDGWNGVFHEAMEKYQGQIVCHNIAFEARWLGVKSKFKIPWSRAHDTMIQAHIINPLGSGALKTLTSQHVDGRAAALQSQLDEGMAKNGWTWGTVPITYQPYWAYGALDCILTVRLWEKFNEQCGPGGPYAKVYDLEMAARRVITEMELGGARVDLEYADKKYQELHDYSERVMTWGRETFDNKRLSSNHDLIKIFEGVYGAQFEEFTPTGQKKCDKVQLKKFSINYSGHPVGALADTVLSMRKASKLAETYFANFREFAVDGLVHPNVRTLGARTSRMSITEPALQTLNKGEKTVRRTFIPRNEDECIITSDLDQVEFRMTAALSEDPGLIALFERCDREDGDAFTEIMREVYQDPSLQKSDPKRKLIKGLIYGKLYGAGVSKMALTAGVPESDMREVDAAFNSRYPGVKQFSMRIEDAGMRRQRSEGQGYVLTQTGRRLPCDEGKVYTLVNYAIQGGAAEVFKLNLLKLDAAGLTPHMIVPVHDEIVMSVPRADVEEIKKVVKDCMTTTEGWAVPLTAGCDGPFENWGEAVDA
jgi:DNA polymerase-1